MVFSNAPGAGADDHFRLVFYPCNAGSVYIDGIVVGVRNFL